MDSFQDIVQVHIPKGCKNSARISENFTLAHISSGTGWAEDTNVNVHWSSSDLPQDLHLRIKNDKRAAIDTDWKHDTQNGVVFYAGTLKELDKKTKIYFATCKKDEAPGTGSITVTVAKAKAAV